jgi:hypothetical protein
MNLLTLSIQVEQIDAIGHQLFYSRIPLTDTKSSIAPALVQSESPRKHRSWPPKFSCQNPVGLYKFGTRIAEKVMAIVKVSRYSHPA